MRVVCQQPNYFPWLGYFEQIAKADSFVYLDDVQWIRQGRQHRCRIPGKDEKNWLTIPVRGHGHRERTFAEMEIDTSQNWPEQHWRAIYALYHRAPFFHSQLVPLLIPYFEKAREFKFLREACEASVALFWKPLGLDATVWHSSDLEAKGKKTERLISLCQSLEATEYYSALGASRYLEPALFRNAGIQLRFQHFRASPVSPLRPCDLSVLDWVAQHEWQEIRGPLGLQRGSLSERAVDGIMPAMERRIH